MADSGRLGIIYCYTNKQNGRMYIGKTVNPLKRKSRHLSGKSKSSYFNSAIKKYGPESFIYEVLALDIPDQDLNDWERWFIGHFNTNGSGGYNLTNGGDGFDSERAKKLAADPKWKLVNQYNLKKTAKDPKWLKENAKRNRERAKDREWIKKVSDGLKKAYGTEEARKKRSVISKRLASTKEWKEKNNAILAEARKKIESSCWEKQSKKFYCVELNKIFDSGQQASMETGVARANITAACKGRIKTAGGYHWEYLGGTNG